MKRLYKLLFAILFIGSINTIQAQITVNYGYDELHRLKSCTYSNGIIVNYNYDALGNRTTVVVSGVASCIAPANLSVTNIGSTGAVLNWSYVSGQTYTIEYKANTSSTWITASGSVNAGTYNLTGLSANTTYNWRVKANCNTTYVDGANFTTIANCIAVSNLSVTNIGSTGAVLNWSYISGQTYIVEYKASSSSTWITASGTINAGTYNLTGLSANTTYNWRVKANCNTTYVDGANFTTLANCVAVTDLTSSNITTNTITLNWTYTAGYSYSIDYRIPPSTTWFNTSSTINLGTITTNGLTPNTTYEFRVKSNCSTNYTDSISVTTLNNCTYPTANFSNSTNGLTISFNNTSTNATSYSWNFGNGQTSTQQNPSVTFATGGTYNICLTATNTCGSTNYCKSVTVSSTCVKPSAQFTFVSNGLTTNFSNASLNGSTYNWNFGNGQTSSVQNPSITFSTSGTYNVCLTATNACDTNMTCKGITVSACDTVNKYDIYNVINTVPQINKEGYFYYNGTHYLVWSNGHYTQTNSNNSYDAKVKLSTSTNGKTWTTQDILNTTIGSTNHVITIDSVGKIHIAYVEGVTSGYYGLQSGRLVYANNVNGIWVKKDTTLGVGNGYPYNWSSPYHLMFGYDGKLRMYYTNAGWYAYGGPLFMRVLEGTTWTSPITISNTNDGGADSQNNLWSFTKKANGQIQVYLSEGWKCTGNGCTETFYNNIKVYTEGTNYTYALTKNIPNTRWYYENKNSDSIKVNADGKSVYINNTLFNTLSGSEIIRYNSWVDNAKQIAIENTNTNSRVFNIANGQSLVNNTGQYVIPANGFQIAVDYSSNPRRLYTIHQGNIQPIIANFNATTNNLNVSFSNTSTNATTYNWNFGNGQTSTIENPSISYTTAGTYNVCLIASNNCNSTQICKQVIVSCPLPLVNFTSTINGSTVSFTNVSTNASSYIWNFGNGQTSTQLNPTINYVNGGNYNVCLSATNSCGTDDTCQTINIIYTGIQNHYDDNILIYPNPNTGVFMIKLDKTIISDVNMYIYNTEGRMVYQQTLNRQQTEINTNMLAAGVYYIKLILSGDKMIQHKLVIVK